MTNASHQHIVVVGEMGVGKTTVGKALAGRLGRTFVDSDRLLEDNERASGAEIADSDGVAALHRAELVAFQTMLAIDRPSVLAPAASVVDDPEGRALLEDAFVVWLTAPDDVLAERQKSGDHRRQVTAHQREELRTRRRPHHEFLADLTVDTGDLLPSEVAAAIASSLEDDAHPLPGDSPEAPTLR